MAMNTARPSASERIVLHLTQYASTGRVNGAKTSLGAGPDGAALRARAGFATAAGSGLGNPSCAGVAPRRVRAVPHSGQRPRVAARPFVRKTGAASARGRMVLQRTQYAVRLGSVMRFSGNPGS